MKMHFQKAVFLSTLNGLFERASVFFWWRETSIFVWMKGRIGEKIALPNLSGFHMVLTWGKMVLL